MALTAEEAERNAKVYTDDEIHRLKNRLNRMEKLLNELDERTFGFTRLGGNG